MSQSNNAMVPYDTMLALSKTLAASQLVPEIMRGKEANVLFAILTGKELGLAPMASIRGIHVIKGKPSLAADTMVAVALSHPLCEYFTLIEETETQCTYETKRRNNAAPSRYTYTLQDQITAKLTEDNHKNHPKAMRRARCKSILARDTYPDLLAGIYAMEEFEPEHMASPLEIAAAAADMDTANMIEKIHATKTVAELKIQGAKIAALALPSESKASIREAYEQQIEILKKEPIAADVPK
jgi:hypothetical protein